MTSASLVIVVVLIQFDLQQFKMSEEQIAEQELKPLASRLKSIFWMVRKRAYEEVLEAAKKAKSIKDELSIRGEPYTVVKFTAILNNLVEEKHPNVLLKGLEGTETILRLDPKTGKLFNKLVVEGLEKFPLLTQQRKPVLQKFLEVLELCKVDAGTLSNRLSLPQDKSVMFVIEVIGALQIDSLKGRLLEIAKKHPKKDVKELAAEIAEQLSGEQPVKEQEKPRTATTRAPLKREQVKKPLKMEMIQKLALYQQLSPKEQQRYSQQLLQSIEQISNLPCSGALSSFSLYIQLMVESNNQIISTNGVKMLTALVRNNSSLLGSSFPLLFLFRKFKVHKTHATNANLLNLVDVLLCSNRTGDLMSAVCQGICCQQNKANLKYGCIISFIRIFSYYYRQPDLFSIYCIGQYTDLYDRIENKRVVEKMLLKAFEIFSKEKEKDKEYGPALTQIRNVLGLGISTITSQKSVKEIGRTDNKSPLLRNKSNVENLVKTLPQASKPPIAGKTTTKTAILTSPEGQLNKILDLLQSTRFSQPSLKKAIDKCLECATYTLQENMYDMYYFCQIAESFIQSYKPNEDTDEIISHFLIEYLKILSGAQIKPSKRNSKITETGLEHLLKLSTTKLVLSKELLLILNNLLASFGFESIVKCLGSLYIMGGLVPKKKNKKYLMRWLEQNASEEFVNSQYFEVIEAIENSGEKRAEKRKIVAPPSIINIPSYKVTPPESKQFSKPVATRQPLKAVETTLPRKQEPELKGKKGVIQQLELLQNADISKIQQIQQQSTDRIQQKWEYFLNKKENNIREAVLEKSPFKVEESQEEEEKYNFSQSQPHEQSRHEHQYYNGMVQRNAKEEEYEQPPLRPNDQAYKEKSEQYEQQQQESQHSDKFSEDQHHSQQQQAQPPKEQIFEYKFLNFKKITDMMNSSNSPFNHLRTLVLLPFKSQPNKHDFLRELTHLIQSQPLRKPQPFNSVMLLVMLLFTEINNDKSIIKPLQVLYEYLAQQCSNNEFLKLTISLYHSVIDQTEEGQQRCMVLTILTKSMIRIMPHVENALELLKDFQQFYQIGEMVYFDMFNKEYKLIREMIENSDGLTDVIYKAYQQQGESLIAIVEGWLQTGFKAVVKSLLQSGGEQQF